MFKKKSSKAKFLRTDFPQGAVVHTESGYYFINGKTKKPIRNKRVLDSWSFPLIIESQDLALRSFITAPPLGYRDGTLIRDISDGKVYLISRQLRRQIVDPSALEMLGKKVSDAIWAAHVEVVIHDEGNDL